MSRISAILLAVTVAACGANVANQVGSAETPAESGGAMTATAVWIDTDPSIRPGGYEVDDGFAMIQAFHSSELDIQGVSLVYGNAALDIEIPIGQELVRRFGGRWSWRLLRCGGVGRARAGHRRVGSVGGGATPRALADSGARAWNEHRYRVATTSGVG